MMKYMKKTKFIVVLITVMVIVVASLSGYNLYRERTRQEEELRLEREAEREAELEIIHTYFRLHYASSVMGHPDTFIIDEEGYRRMGSLSGPRAENIHRTDGRYREIPPHAFNDHGIDVISYLLMKFYYNHTGINLPYELIIDYFSEEFEPDGSLRLYNNGNHPKIEAFVTWMWENRKGEEFDAYVRHITGIHSTYFRANRDQFRLYALHELSPQMLDALVRAEADPNYELDLTSLQEAGY